MTKTLLYIILFLPASLISQQIKQISLAGTYNGSTGGIWVQYKEKGIGIIGMHYNLDSRVMTPTAGIKLDWQRMNIAISGHAGIGFNPSTWQYKDGVFYGNNDPYFSYGFVFWWRFLNIGYLRSVFTKQHSVTFGAVYNGKN